MRLQEVSIPSMKKSGLMCAVITAEVLVSRSIVSCGDPLPQALPSSTSCAMIPGPLEIGYHYVDGASLEWVIFLL